MPPVRLPELSDDILQYLASTQWEETPVCDESDICRDAAALMCAGNAFTTALGKKLYAQVSPFLGDESPNGVSECSTANEMKALLKDWGLTTGGKKAELWERIAAEIEGGSGRCPVSRAAKARAIELQAKRITGSKAKSMFGLTPYFLRDLPSIQEQNQKNSYFGGETMTTYSLRDVKRVAVKETGTDPAKWAEVRGEQQERSVASRARAKLAAVRRGELVEEILRRGRFQDVEAKYPLKVKYMPQVYAYETEQNATAEKLRAAADELEDVCFMFFYTGFVEMVEEEVAIYRAQHRNAKYCETHDAAEAAATIRALDDLCADEESLEDLLMHPNMPPAMTDKIREAWERVHGGGAGAAAAAAAGGAAAAAGGGAAAAAAGGGVVNGPAVAAAVPDC